MQSVAFSSFLRMSCGEKVLPDKKTPRRGANRFALQGVYVLSARRFLRRRRFFRSGTFAAGAAAFAGPAACAGAAAGALPRFSVADHAADQESDDQHDDRDKRDIDKIGRQPCQHRITSFFPLGTSGSQKENHHIKMGAL